MCFAFRHGISFVTALPSQAFPKLLPPSGKAFMFQQHCHRASTMLPPSWFASRQRIYASTASPSTIKDVATICVFVFPATYLRMLQQPCHRKSKIVSDVFIVRALRDLMLYVEYVE